MSDLVKVIADVARALPAAQVRQLASAIESCEEPGVAREKGVAGIVATPAFAMRQPTS